MITYAQLAAQLADASYLYHNIAEAECEAMPSDYWRVTAAEGDYHVGTSEPVEALADRLVLNDSLP